MEGVVKLYKSQRRIYGERFDVPTIPNLVVCNSVNIISIKNLSLPFCSIFCAFNRYNYGILP